MHTYFVRRSTLALVAASLLLVACGDKQVGAEKLKPIHEGMSRDSVMLVMGTGPMIATGSDSVRVRAGFRQSRYLVQGKMYEVLYYREEPGNVDEPVEQAVETPVVLADDKALGWGWKFYVEAMEKYKLPTPLMEKPAPKAATTAPTPAPAQAPAPAPAVADSATRI